MDPAIPADPMDGRRSGEHAAWAWNGSHSAVGRDRDLPAAGNLRSYVSPFVSGPPPAPLHDDDDLDDADALLSFRVPPDSRQEMPGDERQHSRSPIGKQPIGQVHRRKASFSSSQLDPYSGTGGVSLTLLQDDGLSTERTSRFEASSKSDAMSSEYINSPFSTTNMLHSHSLTSSPLSTPSQNISSAYQTRGHSPTRSPEAYASAYSSRGNSAQGAHHHLPALVHTGRSQQGRSGDSEFDLVDKSLAGMFIQGGQSGGAGGSRDNREGGRDMRDTRDSRDGRDRDSRGEYNSGYSGGHMSQSTSGNNLRDYPPQQQQQPSQHHQHHPSASYQQQQQQASHSQSTSPNHTYLPPVVVPSASAPPPSSSATGNSNSGVAYVVLPNGQVQAISMATIQQHLQPSVTPVGRPPIASQSPPVQQSYQHNTPPMQQSYQQPPPPTYDAPSDNDSFSLATLSTQTLPLPLFTPPMPAHPSMRSNPAPYQSQQPLLAPLSQPSQQQLLQQPPSRPSSSMGSTSPYTSPTLPGMSMQQRSSLRRDSAGTGGGHQHHRTSSNNANLLVEQQQQMLNQHSSGMPGHSPIPMPISPLSSPNMQPPPLQPQPQQPQRPGGMPSVSIEHAREQVRLVSAQINSSYPQHSPTSLHYHNGNNGEGMVALAKSQAGSRLLQTKLGQNDPVYFASVFEEVYDAVPDLMTDLFGNYLVQKLISVANDTQRLQLLLKVLPQLLEISCDRQGTRAIQKMIDSLRHASERQLVLEWLSMPMQGALPPPRDRDGHIIYIGGTTPSVSPSPSILTPVSSPPSAPSPSPVSPVGGAPAQPAAPASALTLNGVTHPAMPRLIHLIRDANGSHVVHSILDSFPPDMLSAIHCNAVFNCRSLGIDQHGLCVLKKCLSMCPLSDFVHFTLGFILEHALEYVNNQYGNYLIQHILERTNSVMAHTSPPNFVGFEKKGTAAVNPAAAEHQAKQAQAAVAELASTLAATPTPTPTSTPADAATPGASADDKAVATAADADPAVPASSTQQQKSPEQKAATPPAATSDAPTATPSVPAEPAVEDAATAAARAQLPLINETLFVRLRGHFARLSRQKFSSNVVEKCLKIPDQTIRSAIIAELIDADAIATLLLCSYGNYVLQNVLYVASADECALLFTRVRPEHVLSSLRKNIRLKWERLLANAHLIHPSLTSLNLGAGLATQPMQPPLPLPSPPTAFNPAAGLNVDVSSPDASHVQSSPLLSTPAGSPLYPTPSAVQLITSILGANTPGTGVGILDDGRTTPALGSSAISTPMQLSPAIRSVNHSPMGPRGHFSSSRAGSVTPQQQQQPYAVSQYPNKGPQDRRTLIGSSSQNASAVNSPYYSGSAGPSPGFAPHRGPMPHSSGGGSQYGGSSATSPMLGANSPYGGPSNNQYSSHNYSRSDREPSGGYHYQQQQGGSYQSSPNDGGYSSQQSQSAPYRASPNYPSSTNYNTNPPSYANSSANSPSIKYITNNVQPSSRSQGMPQPMGGNTSGQTIEQQIQAHQAQLNALLALQAQQQPQQHQSNSGYSVTLLPSPQGHQHQSSGPQQQQQQQQQQHYSSSNYSSNGRGSGSYGGGHNPNSPPLMHQSHNQQQYQHRDDRY